MTLGAAERCGKGAWRVPEAPRQQSQRIGQQLLHALLHTSRNSPRAGLVAKVHVVHLGAVRNTMGGAA